MRCLTFKCCVYVAKNKQIMESKLPELTQAQHHTLIQTCVEPVGAVSSVTVVMLILTENLS